MGERRGRGHSGKERHLSFDLIKKYLKRKRKEPSLLFMSCKKRTGNFHRPVWKGWSAFFTDRSCLCFRTRETCFSLVLAFCYTLVEYPPPSPQPTFSLLTSPHTRGWTELALLNVRSNAERTNWVGTVSKGRGRGLFPMCFWLRNT